MHQIKIQTVKGDIDVAQAEESHRREPKPEPSALLRRLLDRNPLTAAPRFVSNMFNLEGY